MSKDRPNWEGLLKWSLSYSDSTRPQCHLSEEERRWFMEAMEAHYVDIIKRMKEITHVLKTPERVLEAQGVTLADIEDLLDELQQHVESIDMANDLHSIGGLVPLLGYLKNSHANIRAKAAEVITTIVQNNPTSQQQVMEANGLEPLITNFTADPDELVRTKALGAISSLIRHNKPGVATFRLANCYAALRDALSSNSVKFQRLLPCNLEVKIRVVETICYIKKALNLIQYLLYENRADCNVVTELGFPRIMTHLVSSYDLGVREAALGGLLELARCEDYEASGSSGGSMRKEDDRLKHLLEERIDHISSMSAEDLGATKEERQLVNSLWSARFNEPSPLQEKGLLILPGDDEPPPDVTGKHFEPPPRVWVAKREQDNVSDRENKEAAPLLLGPPPSTV